MNGELPTFLTSTPNYGKSQMMRYNHLVMVLSRLAATASCSIKGFSHVEELCHESQLIVEQSDPDDALV